jgi:hypothetical protein
MDLTRRHFSVIVSDGAVAGSFSIAQRNQGKSSE